MVPVAAPGHPPSSCELPPVLGAAGPWETASNRPALTVQTVADAGAFTALQRQWNALLRASNADNPFLTWEWLHTWWVHLGEAETLRLIVVRSGGDLLAIAPMRLVNGRVPWLSRLEFLGTGHAGSDYLDLIVTRGHEQACLAAIADFLQAQQLAVRFHRLPAGSLAGRLAQMLRDGRWTGTFADDGTCPVVPLAGHTFDSYLATLGTSHRANFRRRLRALALKFAMRFDLITGDSERRQMLAALRAFSERRWRDQGGSSAFMTPAVQAFQDDATRHALASGWLRLYALRLDGATAAVMYGFQYGGRFYFYQHGFDDGFRDYSVGLVLMGLSIRAALEEGAREFDMLWGVEPYKFLWARQSVSLQRIDLFPPHLGGVLHRSAVGARRHVRRLARRVLTFGESRGS
jgi:CelD/BcsL family acetyltransferase involved in cellulose biosynthesis